MDEAVVYVLGIVDKDLSHLFGVTSLTQHLGEFLPGFSESESRQGDSFQHKWLH